MSYCLKFFQFTFATILIAPTAFGAHHTLDDLVARGAEVEVVADGFVLRKDRYGMVRVSCFLMSV